MHLQDGVVATTLSSLAAGIRRGEAVDVPLALIIWVKTCSILGIYCWFFIYLLQADRLIPTIINIHRNQNERIIHTAIAIATAWNDYLCVANVLRQKQTQLSSRNSVRIFRKCFGMAADSLFFVDIIPSCCHRLLDGYIEVSDHLHQSNSRCNDSHGQHQYGY